MATKRLFDIVASTLGLIILAPLLAFIALGVKLTSKGPVFHRATRVGKEGKLFTLYKFRTMVVDADKVGPGITSANDPRVTRVGRVLRRTKLDELPQLFNVFKGEMSIVGPRPEDPRYVEYYTEEQRKILSIRPGITSLASVQYRHEEKILNGQNRETTYIQELMPAKLKIDLNYIENPSIRADLRIILKTVKALFQ